MSKNVYKNLTATIALAVENARGAFWAVLALTLISGVLPGVQLAAFFALIDNPTPAEAWLVAVIVAFNLGVPQIAAPASQSLTWSLKVAAERSLTETVAGAPVRMLQSEDFQSKVSSARSSVRLLAWQIDSLFNLLSAVIACITIFIATATLSPAVALVTLLTGAPVIWAAARVAKLQEDRWPAIARSEQRSGYLTDLLAEPTSGIELSGFGSRPRIAGLAAAQHDEEADEYRTIGFKSTRYFFVATIASLGLVAAAVSMLVAGDAASALPGLLAIITAVSSVGVVGFTVGQLQTALPQTAAFHAVVSQPAAHRQTDLSSSPPPPLRLTTVSVRYNPSDEVALHVPHLEIPSGRVVGIAGPNGAGKSTLVRALLGEIPVVDGAIEAGTQKLGQTPDDEWNAVFGVLRQDFSRFELTLRGSLLLGTERPVDDQTLWDALESVGLARRVQTIGGLDAQLGSQWPGGAGLSGGEWQRLALARVYLRNAPIWVLDEPTSAIDAESEEAIIADLLERRGDRTVVIVSHRAWVLRRTDHVYVLDGGAICEHGTPTDLSMAGTRFNDLFKSQS